MMMTCLGRSQTASLPHGVNGTTHWENGVSHTGETWQTSAAVTLQRTTDCGAPLQLLLDQNRMLQVNLARSFWRGIGDIKEALVPNHINNLNMNTSTFYIEEDNNVLLEDDNFFEDMTSLYRKQAVLFQRSCEQIKDVYRVDITPPANLDEVSPFGEVSKEGGEDLYLDVLYCLIHMIGCDTKKINQFELVEHLRKAFQIEPKRHLELYNEVSVKPDPRVKLSLGIIEAKELVSKDISGSNNPYCTFYVSSSKDSPQSTSCKPQTLNPVWNETFTMDIEHKDPNERLHIDVWNFDTGDGIVNRLKRVGEVKDSRGLKLLITDTMTPPTGDKLIGHIEIQLKTLPACGTNKWWNLYKIDGKQRKERGEIHLIQHLFTREDQLKEHTRLLKVLLSHELIKRNNTAYTWRDNFSKETLQILAQHAIQSRMSRVDTALTRLLVYTQMHLVLPLDCRVFIPILEKLRKPVLANQIADPLVKEFHEASEKLVAHFTTFIRKHRLYIGNNGPKYSVQLEAILKALHILHTLKWRTRNDIVLQVEDALLASVREWFNFVIDRIPTQEKSQNGRMKNLTRITHLLMADIEEGRKHYQNMFWENLNIDYVEIAYREFDQNLTLITKALIDKACEDMKPILFKEEEKDNELKSSLTVGTQLFELYLAMQQFYTLGFSVLKKGIASDTEDDDRDDFTVFHSWFIRAVAKWLDIALYKAMVRIVKAVRIDDLKPVDELSNHTSSAVDLRTVLNQIKTFWTQLSWPDVETSYVFISRIMDDVCKAIIFYAEKMCSKAEELKRVTNNDQLLHCSAEQCLAINNINFVMSYINPFVCDLGIESVLTKLEQQKGGLVADACRKTIRTLMKNSIENVENQILTILEDVGSKMAPTIETFLFEGQVHCSSSADRRTLLQYLDENLVFLKSRLVPANFERVLSVMWAVSAKSLSDIVHKSIEKKKPSQFFVSLYETFKVLLNFFYGEKIPQDGCLLSTKHLLELFASDSDALINNFYKQRLEDQRSIPSGNFPLGSINVRIQYLRAHLRVQVLNCRHLKPLGSLTRSNSGNLDNHNLNKKLYRNSRLNKSSHNLRSMDKMDFIKEKYFSLRLSVKEVRQLAHRTANNGMCSPYVSVKLVPGPSGHPELSKVSTKCQPRTLFPLFDETFDMLVPETTNTDSCFLLFSVKDKGPLGDKLLLGEALVPLTDISQCDQDCVLTDLDQIQLPLTRPGSSVIDILTAIETRRSSLNKETRRWLVNERRKLLL